VDYDQQIADAHAALLSVKKSDNVLVNIHTTLQKPLAELSRLEFQELRKLAHHAYYGIGACGATFVVPGLVLWPPGFCWFAASTLYRVRCMWVYVCACVCMSPTWGGRTFGVGPS
jgi:hypothetical protein